jgi:Concanavalin A-like lectin/glucanases superfamily
VGGAIVQTPFDKADRNRWTHYALTYQVGRIQGFKNGQLVGEAKGRVVVVGKEAALDRHWWHHGAVTSSRFIGAFDDLRIYQRALTPSQIKLLPDSSKR